MRPDQLQKLQSLSEALADVVLDEADPAHWPAAGVRPADQTREERGDRYWAKKSAAATFSLLITVEKLTTNTQEALGREAYEDGELDQQSARAEGQAARLLDKMTQAAKKAEFDKRTHGKA